MALTNQANQALGATAAAAAAAGRLYNPGLVLNSQKTTSRNTAINEGLQLNFKATSKDKDDKQDNGLLFAMDEELLLDNDENHHLLQRGGENQSLMALNSLNLSGKHASSLMNHSAKQAAAAAAAANSFSVLLAPRRNSSKSSLSTLISNTTNTSTTTTTTTHPVNANVNAAHNVLCSSSSLFQTTKSQTPTSSTSSSIISDEQSSFIVPLIRVASSSSVSTLNNGRGLGLVVGGGGVGMLKSTPSPYVNTNAKPSTVESMSSSSYNACQELFSILSPLTSGTTDAPDSAVDGMGRNIQKRGPFSSFLSNPPALLYNPPSPSSQTCTSPLGIQQQNQDQRDQIPANSYLYFPSNSLQAARSRLHFDH